MSAPSRLMLATALLLTLTSSGCVLAPAGLLAGSRPGPDATATTTAQDVPATSAPETPAVNATNFVLILDASGSMKAADMTGGIDRMTAARDAGMRFLAALPADSRVSLVTYGDQVPEDAPLAAGCQDVSVKAELGHDRAGIESALAQLTPSGWTPISGALRKAAEQVPAGEAANIVLVTDGEDSCAPPEPCDTSGRLVSANPNLTISTIGVRASSAQFACIAQRGKGISVTADSAAQLARRLPALSNPEAVAGQLSPQGAARITLGTDHSAIQDVHPDFPDLPAARDRLVVIWRNCEWIFDDAKVLREIVLQQNNSTIDGIVSGDPEIALEVLGAPVKTEPAASGGETRFYVADQRLKLAWKITVVDGRVHTITLCTCLPEAPCPPSDEMARQLQDDPTMRIIDRQCTRDNSWAVFESTFESDQRGGFLILRREGTQWRKVRRITHGGGCLSLTPDMPLKELDPMMKGMCGPMVGRAEVMNAQITTDGLGPLKLGTSAAALESQGFVFPTTTCGPWEQTAVVPEGVFIEIRQDRLATVMVREPMFSTPSGAKVGMPITQVQRIYPGKLTKRQFDGEGGPRQSYVYASGDRIIEFVTGPAQAPTSTVTHIAVSSAKSPWVGGC